MKDDPRQLNNLLSPQATETTIGRSFLGRDLDSVVDRLDALMMVVKSCKQSSCTHPWDVLHPQGDAQSLGDALSSGFDSFYREQPKVSFDSCELGYIRDKEGPQDVIFYRDDSPVFDLDGGNQKPLAIDPDWSIWI